MDDGVLLQLNQERLFKVMAPKVIGAWNLHAQTLNAPLDFFINFSSFTSLVGNPGQGNYVAASVFLDELAHYRCAMGLPALTINWGALADVGHVARDTEVGEHLERIGIKSLLSQQALSVLGKLLLLKAVQTAVASVNWQRWCQVHPAGGLPRFFHLTGEKAVAPEASDLKSEGDPLRNALMASGPTERRQLLESRLREQVARVLGTSFTKLDSSKSLTNLGLDSLMAVELSNLINNLQLGVSIGSMKLLEGISITQLATILLTAMGAATETLAQAIEQVDSETLAQTLAELEQLSEEEVQAILASEKLS
ncbi:beta-ketoacyl reductase [Nostoc sp.]